MIFGRTAEERKALKNARDDHYGNWHRYFAWLPRKLIDGRWAWLEEVERINYYAPTSTAIPLNIPYSNRHCGWAFRLPSDN